MIYEPKGKAREYSPLALNLYMNCSHRCQYCYCASTLKMKKEDFYKPAEPRRNVLRTVEKEISNGAAPKQVLLSFIGDVYSETSDDNKLTRNVLELFLKHGVKTAILTKGGTRALKDIDIFKSFNGNIQIGATLTFLDAEKSKFWEPNAALPADRIEMLKTLKAEGVRTFVSFEPVIETAETLSLIDVCLAEDCVDVFKVGKLNGMKTDSPQEWVSFLDAVVKKLRAAGKQFYIKKDLREAAPEIELRAEEIDMDKYNL